MKKLALIGYAVTAAMVRLVVKSIHLIVRLLASLGALLRLATVVNILVLIYLHLLIFHISLFLSFEHCWVILQFSSPVILTV